VLLVHGDADAVVMVPAMYAAIVAVQAVGSRCSGRCPRGPPHGIDPDSIAHGAAFLAAALAESDT
jgi:predicted esterase